MSNPRCSHPSVVEVRTDNDLDRGTLVAYWCPDCETQMDVGAFTGPPRPPGGSGGVAPRHDTSTCGCRECNLARMRESTRAERVP